MEEKHELFWKQGDFGYVKDVKDSLMTFCKPEKQVCPVKQLSGFCCNSTVICSGRFFTDLLNEHKTL